MKVKKGVNERPGFVEPLGINYKKKIRKLKIYAHFLISVSFFKRSARVSVSFCSFQLYPFSFKV